MSERVGVAAGWRKSSFSGGDGGDCVEVAEVRGGSLVRDSKNRAGAVLSFDTAAWSAFVRSTAARSG